MKKPIVTTEWLDQCWKEHRVVPHEPYRVPPFSGLTICVSGIPAGWKFVSFSSVTTKRWQGLKVFYLILLDERKEMEKLIIQNGGIYSAELTKRCSHLICDISCLVVLFVWISACPLLFASPELPCMRPESEFQLCRDSLSVSGISLFLQCPLCLWHKIFSFSSSFLNASVQLNSFCMWIYYSPQFYNSLTTKGYPFFSLTFWCFICHQL